MSMSRSLTAIDQGHLAKEVSLREFSKNQVFLVVITNADPHTTTLNQIHRVTHVALTKETRVPLTILFGKQAAQFSCCIIVEGGKERHRTKRLERHLTSRVLHKLLRIAKLRDCEIAGFCRPMIWPGFSPNSKFRNPNFAIPKRF